MSEKKSTVMMKIMIILVTLSAGVVNLVTPILSTLSELYPNVSENVIIMANTIPYLTAIPTSLLCATICRRIGTKRTILISILLEGVGGAIPAVFSDYSMVLVSRAIFGFGWGILMTVPLSLVGEYLPLSQQGGFIGIVMAMMSVGSSGYTMLGGLLAGNIKVLWATNLVNLLFFVPILLSFPKDKKYVADNNAAEKTEVKKGSLKLPVAFFILLALNMILNGIVVQGMNLTSFFIEDSGLGGAALAASVLTVYGLANMAGGFLSGIGIKMMKKRTGLITCVIVGATYIMFAYSTNSFMLFATMIVSGLIVSITNSVMYLHNAWVVPTENYDIATSITSGGSMIAGFFLVYIPTIIAQIIGVGGYQGQYVIIGALFIAVAVGYNIVLNAKGVKENVDKVVAESYGPAVE